jgi:hypothetical protein
VLSLIWRVPLTCENGARSLRWMRANQREWHDLGRVAKSFRLRTYAGECDFVVHQNPISIHSPRCPSTLVACRFVGINVMGKAHVKGFCQYAIEIAYMRELSFNCGRILKKKHELSPKGARSLITPCYSQVSCCRHTLCAACGTSSHLLCLLVKESRCEDASLLDKPLKT